MWCAVHSLSGILTQIRIIVVAISIQYLVHTVPGTTYSIRVSYNSIYAHLVPIEHAVSSKNGTEASTCCLVSARR